MSDAQTTSVLSPIGRSWQIDLSLLTLRVITGVIFATHGAQKAWGWFGGMGWAQTVEKMDMGPVAHLVIIGEFFGGVGLIIGLLTRFSAASLIVIMIGAIAMVHGKNGLLLQNGGFEYNLALIGLCVPIMLCGPGGWLVVGKCLPLPRSKKTGRTLIGLE